MKRPLYAALALALTLSLAACAKDAPESSSSGSSTQSSSANAGSSTVSASSSADLVKQTVTDCLSSYYDAEDILSISTSGTKVEVKIRNDASAAGEAPDNWADLRTAALECGQALKDSLTDCDINNAIIYLVDSDDNNLLSVLNGNASYDAFGGTDNSSGTDNPPTISLDEFDAIKTGMEYQEVFDLVGSRGEVLSETDLGLGDEYYTAIYQWEGEGSIGANANVTFQGGKVVSKAQFGLG